MANKNTGYQGFTPYAFRPVESAKPGERGQLGKERRDNKFKRAGVDVLGYKDSEEYASTTSRAGGLVRASHYASRERPTPIIKIKDRRPMVPKKFVAKSLSSTTLPNHSARLRILEEITEEDVHSTFSSFDKDGSGYVHRRDIKRAFSYLTKNRAQHDVVDTFHALLEKNEQPRISLQDFKDGLSRLHQIVSDQLNTHASRHQGPAWALEEKAKVLKDVVPHSTAQIDIGVEGHDPKTDRTVMRGNGMKSTTDDLFAGTSKVTSHIPGYRGFISSARPAKAEQPRDSKDHMFIVDNFKGNAPVGYTGNPKTNLRSNRGSMETDKSRADKLVVNMWKQRDRNPRSQFL
eukprot:g193.t1